MKSIYKNFTQKCNFSKQFIRVLQHMIMLDTPKKVMDIFDNLIFSK